MIVLTVMEMMPLNLIHGNMAGIILLIVGGVFIMASLMCLQELFLTPYENSCTNLNN